LAISVMMVLWKNRCSYREMFLIGLRRLLWGEGPLFIMIKMFQGAKEAENNKWAIYHALKMQELWKREIDEAIKRVKGDIPKRDYKEHRRRRKRGYWTPSGFAWFKQRGKW
jgi:hypothetical protein